MPDEFLTVAEIAGPPGSASVLWDPTNRNVRLVLTGDARYDEKLIEKLGRTRDAGSWPPVGGGGMG